MGEAKPLTTWDPHVKLTPARVTLATCFAYSYLV